MKKSIGVALACALFIGGAASMHAAAADAGKKPLGDVFDKMVIVAYGQNKMFDNGVKNDLADSKDIVTRDGRLLVPIRMMGTLATRAGHYHGTWDAVWKPEAPNDVLLQNTNLHKSVKLTVGSKTMLVNNEPQTLDTAPQKVNGRIVLPLRGAAEALDMTIDWLDGLILIGDTSVDLQSKQTLAVKDKIKAELADSRARVDYKDAVYPVTQYGSDVYYYKSLYTNAGETQMLFRRTGGQQAAQVQLPGSSKLDSAKVIDGKLYYVTVVSGKVELDAYDLSSRKSAKICVIDQWQPGDGWVADIRAMDGEIYLNLHRGDLTIGSETLYKAGPGTATAVTTEHSFNGFVKAGQYMYDSSFTPIGDAVDNLNRTDLKNGASTAIGAKGFTYGVTRSISSDMLSYGMSNALYVQDGFLYTLGYKDSDPNDVSAVYKLDLAKGTQVKLTPPASDFWLVNGRIYYIDSAGGYLKSVRTDGSDNTTLTARKAANVQFAGGGVYYTVSANPGNVLSQGDLYRFDLAKASEAKIGDRPVRSFYAGPDSVYYVSDGYEPGIYKIDSAGRNVNLVHDSIETAKWTAAGMVYTKSYEKGIFSAK
ncbi:DUF5050 domain-containing protein [Paenibacillus lycopersici]|uniref:DUF5050 domain-containing protein n=1 Tax=Paenibacillus lycopersici TaxID=2704462 RepID=A0A6C0FRN4_9BACL|nr:DUF5050 domain-containing protein [Paenibacillus lycopersici]QHT59816.1 DUF5050 domain-containing protein [Paenibacillus lycopersici]